MRLEPVEKPRGPAMWLAHFMSRRLFGKVIGPIRVLYARQPRLLKLGVTASRIEQFHLRVPADLVLLMRTYGSSLNGCAFCQDLTRARAMAARLGEERFNALSSRRGSACFTAAERAALDLVEAYHRDRRVPDETFDRLRNHFTEEQIVDLVWVNAIDEYWNALTIPLEIPADDLAAARR